MWARRALSSQNRRFPARAEAQKAVLKQLAHLKTEIAETNWAIEENERRLNVERAADLRYQEPRGSWLRIFH